MYIDGHERKDVVAYQRGFVERWMTYELRFHHWDDDGRELPRPNGFPVPDGVPFQLVLITHDESTFFQNDQYKTVGSEDQPANTTAQRRWPIDHDLRLLDIRVGSLVQRQ
jgi:hypothetical protein